jgi:4-hydroxythreonine-4-phosphate dehydrogenase
MSAAPRFAVTLGDPAGIGPEVIVKALLDPGVRAACRFVVVGDAGVVRAAITECGLTGEVVEVAAGEWPDAGAGAIPVLDLANAAGVPRGEASAAGGRAAWEAIDRGVALCMGGDADALVTAPINKVALDLSGLGHEGHTEILQAMTGAPWSLTLFVVDRLRVVYLTRHLSLRDAIDAVTADRIVSVTERFASVAPGIGLPAPRIAIAALNPHAGEGGLFGTEEIEHIEPGIARLRSAGLDVHGPVPADSVFHQARHGRYDVVISLYHDQAASVTKTLDFDGTVSITLGLPFPRFSVDHGTAFDIVGRGIADARNMITTLKTGADMMRTRTPAGAGG